MHRNLLIEQPRFQPSPLVPLKHGSSLCDWLESTGRMVAPNPVETESPLDEEGLEVSGLMDAEEIVDDFDILDGEDDLGVDEE